MSKLDTVLHVILLLDTSGSMFENNKIDILNEAVSDIIKGFRKIDFPKIYVSIITFADKPNLYLDFTYVNDIGNIEKINAKGSSMIAEALKMTKSKIIDLECNDYKPVIILISDGSFNDEWKSEFADFINDDVISKVQRISFSIGKIEEAEDSLKMFSDNGIFYTLSDAENIFMLLTLNKLNDIENNLDGADLISYYKDYDL